MPIRKKKTSLILSVFAVFLVFLFALSPMTKAAAKQVLVVQIDNQTTVTLVKDLSGLKISDSLLCVSADYINQYYSGSKSKYYADKAKVAQYRTDEMQYTLLNDEIMDAQSSLNNINQRIASLEKTAAYLDSLKNLNGLTLYGIPAGHSEIKEFEYASNIAMKCLRPAAGGDRVETVGNLTGDYLSWFNIAPADQISVLKKFDRENRIMSQKIIKEIADNGKIGKGTIISLIGKMSDMRDTMAANAISITADEIKYYPTPQSLSVNNSFSINYNLDKNGKPQHHPIPGFLKLILSIAGVKDSSVVDASLSLGDITYSEVWLPEQTILKGMREDNAKQIKRFKKLQTQFQAIIAQLQNKLDIVKKSL